MRDELLGRTVADRDFVVVGATPEQMVAAGYRPVGSDFPVFLHPQTNDEYALAAERKRRPGLSRLCLSCDARRDAQKRILRDAT